MQQDPFDLKDKVALVTGASRGIGRQIALGLAGRGADLVLAGRKIDPLKEVAAEIESLGRQALPVSCHMGKTQDIAALVDAAKDKFGRVDILVNNAATNPVFGPSLLADEAVWDKIMAVNLKGPFFLCKAIAEDMKTRQGGKIINLSSVAGMQQAPGLGLYGISKAGVLMMTRVLAFELGTYGINVNCVAPGLVRTKFSQALWATEEILEEVLKTQPIKRIGEPEDIVGAVIYLASGASDFVTGTTIIVDGGSYA